MNTKYIGIDSEENGIVCLDCAYNNSVNGYLFKQEAYPDGFTCEECGESIADQDYKSEA